MTRTAWRESLERLEAQLERFIRTDANGEDYYVPHPSLRRLYKFHDRLVCAGLEHGWLDLDTNGQLTTEGAFA